jgi:hypothetical protein
MSCGGRTSRDKGCARSAPSFACDRSVAWRASLPPLAEPHTSITQAGGSPGGIG